MIAADTQGDVMTRMLTDRRTFAQTLALALGAGGCEEKKAPEVAGAGKPAPTAAAKRIAVVPKGTIYANSCISASLHVRSVIAQFCNSLYGHKFTYL